MKAIYLLYGWIALGILMGCGRMPFSPPPSSPAPTSVRSTPTAWVVRWLGPGYRIRLSADGRRGAAIGWEESLFLWDAGRGAFEPLRVGPEGQPAAGIGPALSANSRLIAFFARQHFPDGHRRPRGPRPLCRRPLAGLGQRQRL